MSLVDFSTQVLTTLESCFQTPTALEQLQRVFEQIQAQIESDGGFPAANDMTLVVFDLALRQLVEKLAWKMLNNQLSPREVGIPELLDLCIDAAVQGCLLNNAPYRVLEDLIQSQTIKVSESLWDLLEERRDRLTTDVFIVPGKNTKASLNLLKLCNFLLRKLSKTHNNVFCGRVLAFLAYTFSLSERSALNLGRKSNINNITKFEDEETFNITKELEAQVAQRSDDDDSPMQVDEDDGPKDKMPLDYNFYKTFWNILRFCRASTQAINDVEGWKKFSSELDTVLQAFEGNAFSPDDLERAKELSKAQQTNPASAESGDAITSDNFFQPKYLTNSRLLRLQLRDPVLRQCMLTQFMILIDCWSRLKMTPDVSALAKSSLPDMEKRVQKLLEMTPPDGERFTSIVAHVLERERNWTLWKMDKCPPYEREPLPPISVDKKRKSVDSENSSRPLKALSTGPRADGASSFISDRILSSDASYDNMSGLDDVSRKNDIQLSEFTERFTEAWDPENDIDEMYWPQHDLMHCWRTMRRTYKEKVMTIKFASKGISEMIHQITGIKPPESKTQVALDEMEVDNVVDENNASRPGQKETAETKIEKKGSPIVEKESESAATLEVSKPVKLTRAASSKNSEIEEGEA